VETKAKVSYFKMTISLEMEFINKSMGGVFFANSLKGQLDFQDCEFRENKAYEGGIGKIVNLKKLNMSRCKVID